MRPERCGRVAILGQGRAGLSLCLALRHLGSPPALVWERAPARAALLAPILGPLLRAGPEPPALDEAEVWILAVPDGALPELAAGLAARCGPRPDAVALHLAGALEASVLAPLGERGLSLGSLHPVRSLPDPLELPAAERGAQCAALFAGTACGLQGEPLAAACAQALLARLGATALPLRPGGKAAYHAACVLASNGLVALLAEATRLARAAMPPETDPLQPLLALARGAAAQVEALGPGRALTGPVRRADVATVAAHRAALRGDPAEDLYLALARSSLRLSESKDGPSAALARLAELLDEV